MFAYQQDIWITVPESPWPQCCHPSPKLHHKLDASIRTPTGGYGLDGEGWREEGEAHHHRGHLPLSPQGPQKELQGRSQTCLPSPKWGPSQKGKKLHHGHLLSCTQGHEMLAAHCNCHNLILPDEDSILNFGTQRNIGR